MLGQLTDLDELAPAGCGYPAGDSALLSRTFPFYGVLDGGSFAWDFVVALQVLTSRLQALQELGSAFVHLSRLLPELGICPEDFGC